MIPVPALRGMLCSRLMEPTSGSSFEVRASRTYSLLQPDLQSLEDSGTSGSLNADAMGDSPRSRVAQADGGGGLAKVA